MGSGLTTRSGTVIRESLCLPHEDLKSRFRYQQIFSRELSIGPSHGTETLMLLSCPTSLLWGGYCKMTGLQLVFAASLGRASV